MPTDKDQRTGQVFPVLELSDFDKWRSAIPGNVAHVKGFSKGVSGCYDANALWEVWKCGILAWDGDAPADTGFTAVLLAFLREKPERKAVAFIESSGIEEFQSNWQKHAAEFKERIIIVTIDLKKHAEQFGLSAERVRVQAFPSRAQDVFLVGRAAMKATGSKQVIALGGDNIVAQQAEASLSDGVSWNVYALSRGSKEQQPSVMDWAAKSERPNVTFLYWQDPKYADSFAGTAPPACPMPVLSLADFIKQRTATPADIAHIKGFGKGMQDCYTAEALALLDSYSLIVWDGDPPSETGFTALVSAFLREKPERKAVAFKKRDGIEQFQGNWQKQAAEFKGRIVVVAIDAVADVAHFGLSSELDRVSALPKWGQQFYLLGRVAVKATESKRVIALGGGGIAKYEAEASFGDGVKWTVYALSRGSKEQYPSLMDWAAETDSPNLTFIWGKDLNYADSFAGKPPGSHSVSAKVAVPAKLRLASPVQCFGCCEWLKKYTS